MSEKKFINIIQRIHDKKVKCWVSTSGARSFGGYIVDIGEDYIQLRGSLKKKDDDDFIVLSSIDRISTDWKE